MPAAVGLLPHSNLHHSALRDSAVHHSALHDWAVPDPGTRALPSAVPLRLSLAIGSRQNTLTVEGDLDLAAAGRFSVVLRRLELDHHRLVVDLRGLTFADSHGLTPLVATALRRSDRPGSRVRLTRVPPAVHRLLGLLDATELFDVAPPRPAPPVSR